MVELVDGPIDVSAVLDFVQNRNAGATVLFVGTTREMTGGKQTVKLDYESHRVMAVMQLEKLESEARTRWDLLGVSIIHRLGDVAIGEASIAIAVSSAHRKQAFEAGEWLIDTIKKEVPIWKREEWSDGSLEWVHPVS